MDDVRGAGSGDGKGKGSERPKIYDLTERTAVFGERVIGFVKELPSNDVASPLKRQLLDAGTSIGANYAEADQAGTKKEFRHRVSICKRESRESIYWLRMLIAAVPDCKPEALDLRQEADELNRIFAAIYRKSGDEKQKESRPKRKDEKPRNE